MKIQKTLIAAAIMMFMAFVFMLTKGMNGLSTANAKEILVEDPCFDIVVDLDTSAREIQARVDDCGSSLKDDKKAHTKQVSEHELKIKEITDSAKKKREIMEMKILDLGISISQEYADELGLVLTLEQESQKSSAQ